MPSDNIVGLTTDKSVNADKAEPEMPPFFLFHPFLRYPQCHLNAEQFGHRLGWVVLVVDNLAWSASLKTRSGLQWFGKLASF